MRIVIDDGAYRTALVSAIEESRTFSQVVPEGTADYYKLYVAILHVDMDTDKATIVSEWRLSKMGDTTPVFHDWILTNATGTSAFNTDAEEAVAAAARKNMAEGLQRLSALNL